MSLQVAPKNPLFCKGIKEEKKKTKRKSWTWKKMFFNSLPREMPNLDIEEDGEEEAGMYGLVNSCRYDGAVPCKYW